MAHEVPRIFTAPSIRAIMAGHKTQTRRIAHEDESIRYDVGDHFWAKETLVRARSPASRVAVSFGAFYAATGTPVAAANGESPATWMWSRTTLSPIFMPRWACRLVLELTAMRVEALHAITTADAIAEGMTGDYPIDGYAQAWDAINARRAPEAKWEHNPRVRVLTFKVVG
jgi:hypothetical protein